MAYAHQVAGTKHLASRSASAIMADPGTGKTKIFLDAIGKLPGATVLVFCPVSVKLNWKDEIKKWLSDWQPLVCVMGGDDYESFMKSLHNRKILIVGIESLSSGKTYEKLAKFVKPLKENKDTYIVVDESHLIKNHSAKRTARATVIGRYFNNRVTMTGTPTTGKLVDLFAQFRFLDPNLFGENYYKFRNRYCIMGGYGGKEIVGYRNVDELEAKIDHYSFRARKEDCLDLPDKVYVTRRVDLMPDQRRAYTEAHEQLVVSMKDQKHGIQNALEKMLRCNQITSGILRTGTQEEELSSPKIRELMSFIEGTDDQVVIWSAYRSELFRAQRELEKAYPGQVVVVHGDVNEDARKEARDLFQAGKRRFFLGTASAGGIGITLTASSTTVYLSNTFHSTHRIQSEDRIHRIGQTRCVTIIDIVCAGTTDEAVLESLRQKKNVIDGVLKGDIQV